MIIGVPKEIKNNEKSCIINPCRSTRVGTERSHGVYTTHRRYKTADFPMKSMRKSGARILPTIEDHRLPGG